jgi:hypothetical protein
LHWVLLPIKKNAQQNAALRQCTQARSPFWLLTPASENAHVRLLPRLSWSWPLLLPGGTRKPIRSITAVLLPFVTYLLTVLRIYQNYPEYVSNTESVQPIPITRLKFQLLRYKCLHKWQQMSETLLEYGWLRFSGLGGPSNVKLQPWKL